MYDNYWGSVERRVIWGDNPMYFKYLGCRGTGVTVFKELTPNVPDLHTNLAIYPMNELSVLYNNYSRDQSKGG